MFAKKRSISLKQSRTISSKQSLTISSKQSRTISSNNLEQSRQNNLEQSRQNNLEQSRQNNLEKSYTEKKSRHEPSDWAMLTRCSFDEEENKLDYYKGKDSIEKLCKKLKERAMKIINYEEKNNDDAN